MDKQRALLKQRGLMVTRLNKGDTITNDAESDLYLFEVGYLDGHQLSPASVNLAWRALLGFA